MKLKKQKPMERGAGVLMPVTSLPSPYGVGAFGRAAYEFVDFLKAAGQKYWQVLPLGPTSYGDSPYQSFSAFSGNPYFIDLDTLLEEGFLTEEEIAEKSWGDDPESVDYSALYRGRFEVLQKAYLRSRHQDTAEYRAFCEENQSWLEDYSLFMAVKNSFGGKEWLLWPEEIRMREPAALSRCREKLKDDVGFWKFCQFQFFEQWGNLKAYANQNGIQIIGDIPIYVALDSADVWAHGEQFQLDGERRPTGIAGVPPDLFSETGQLWGNPLYDWERMEREEFAWWKERMAFSAKLYDVIRIDHFVGIAHYYSIPYGDKTAENGHWIDGPGEKLIAAINSAIGEKKVIAENLGVVTPEVDRILEKSGYPGMKLMQFGFDSGPRNANLPSYFEKNSVVYGGTHDNETLAGFFARQKRSVLKFAREYLNVRTNKEIPAALIRAGYASVADTAVFQLQDLLGLDNSARINTPATLGGNWRWRVKREMLTEELAGQLKRLAELYGRA